MLPGGATVNSTSIESALSAEGGGGAPAAVAGPVVRPLSESEGLFASKRSGADNKTYRRRVASLSLEDPRFKQIRDLQVAAMVPRLLDRIDQYMLQFASGINYMAPLRARAERYYRPQDLSVDEVDFQGANLPMFLRNLRDSELKSFSAWTEENLGFSITASFSGGHISLLTHDLASGNQYNVSDVGFGFSQILPIAAQLWALSRDEGRRRTRRSRTSAATIVDAVDNVPIVFAIEQPELHLHPGLQARVTDLLLTTISAARDAGQDLRLVVETHSETIVNHLGHRIAADRVDPSDVQVVLFEQVEPDLTEVRLVEYDSEGFLSNWPFGFFEPDQYSMYGS